MRKLLAMLFCLFTVASASAKNKHAAKGHAVKKHHPAHHVAHHAVRSPKVPLIKPDTTGVAVIDTAHKNYTGIEYLLSVLAKELGKPYKLGSAGPTGFDCSGLINYAFSFIGISLPRTSTDIGQLGQKIAFNELQPGDLLFFAGRKAANAKINRIGHVACVYKVDEASGKVLMIHSSDEGVNITELNNSKYYMERLISARRIFGLDSCGTPRVKTKG